MLLQNFIQKPQR